MNRRLLGLSALSLAIAIGMGAFGRHGLRDVLTEPRLATFETAQHYHLLISLALMVAALTRSRTWTTNVIAAGLVVFSVSLYLLALTGLGWLGAITPVGGALMILGWCGFASGFLSGRDLDRQESQFSDRHKTQQNSPPSQNQE